MSIKIAFTGTGYIAQIHARAVQHLPGVEAAAVVNHRPASSAYADYKLTCKGRFCSA